VTNPKTSSVERAFKTLDDIFTLGRALVSAISDEDPERVEEVLSRELASSLSRAAAEARARRKYGAF